MTTPTLAKALRKGVIRQQQNCFEDLDRLRKCASKGSGCRRFGPTMRRRLAEAKQIFGDALLGYDLRKNKLALLVIHAADTSGTMTLLHAEWTKKHGFDYQPLAELTQHCVERFYERTKATDLNALYEEFNAWWALDMATRTSLKLMGGVPVSETKIFVGTRTGVTPMVWDDKLGVFVATTWWRDDDPGANHDNA